MSNVPSGGVAFEDLAATPVPNGGSVIGIQYRKPPMRIVYGQSPVRYQRPLPLLFRRYGQTMEFELVTYDGEPLTLDGEPITL